MLYACPLSTAGSTLLIFLGLLGLVTVAALHQGPSAALAHLADGRTLLVLAVLTGIAISFPVLPSFPQCYMPLIPFVIVLIAALYGTLGARETGAAKALLVTIALAALTVGGPRLFADLPSIVTSECCTPVTVHTGASALGILALALTARARYRVARHLGDDPSLCHPDRPLCRLRLKPDGVGDASSAAGGVRLVVQRQAHDPSF